MNRFSLPLFATAACTEWNIEDDEVLGLSTSDDVTFHGEDCDEDACEGGIVISNSGATEQDVCLQFSETQIDDNLVSSSQHSGLAVGDYNQDGDEDVFILNENSPNQLFENLGGIFSQAETSGGIATFSARAAVFSDYDGDGDLDLAMAGDDGLAIYKNNQGIFVQLNLAGATDFGAVSSVDWVDSGFLFATENGTRFYEYPGNDSFVENTAARGLDDYGSGAHVAVADYDGDSRQDVFVANFSGQNRLFKNLGGTAFDSVEESVGVSGVGNLVSTSAVWAKLINESKPSLYVTNWDGGNEFYIQDDNGFFVDQAAALGLRDAGNTTHVIAASLHAEMDPFFYLGRSNQPNLLYYPTYNSNGVLDSYEDAGEGLHINDLGVNMGAQWFDYDNDGDLDLVTVMYDGTVKLYRNQTHDIEPCED